MRCIGVLVLLAGCSQIFGLSKPAHGTGDGGDDAVDAAIPDASVCTTVSAECIGDVLRTCSAPGEVPVDATCNWGCGGNAPHCFELMPTGGGVTTQDLAPDASLADVSFSVSTVIIDTDTGAIGTAAQPNLVRPSGTGVKNGIDFHIAGNVGVFRFASLSISATTTPVGARAIALVAAGEINVSAPIDAQAPCRGQGLLGGYAGGAAALDGSGPGGGLAGMSNAVAGCGGGHGGQGGKGGRNGNGGAMNGDAAITTLVGGSGGGAGGSSQTGGHGGAGGGALELVSGTRITVSAGINAGGCGGAAGTGGNQGGGGGGGAGGTLLFEAPEVAIPAPLAVNGGGGGASLGGGDGANGTLDRMAAAGGMGNANGGTGAAGGGLDGADGATNGTPAGGGGGAIGRIRVNTRDGSGTLNGNYSPSPSDPQTTFTVGTAALQ